MEPWVATRGCQTSGYPRIEGVHFDQHVSDDIQTGKADSMSQEVWADDASHSFVRLRNLGSV